MICHVTFHLSQFYSFYGFLAGLQREMYSVYVLLTVNICCYFIFGNNFGLQVSYTRSLSLQILRTLSSVPNSQECSMVWYAHNGLEWLGGGGSGCLGVSRAFSSHRAV